MMLQARNTTRWIAPAWLLAGCNIDTLWAEFHDTEPPGHSTTTTSSDESSDTGTASTAAASTTTEDDATTGTTTGDETSTSDTTANTSTGEPSSVCGDGIPQPGEECDDANLSDDDACTTTCFRPRLIFTTSELFSGADVNGLHGADNRCRHAASAASLPNPLNFKALLSDSTTHAKDRLFHAHGPYRLVNGLQVARDFDALLHDTLDHPVDTTELGTDAFPYAWTGTQLGGTAVPGDGHCEDWHSGSLFDYGVMGRATAVDAEWLNVANPVVNPTDCASQNTLYCLEQE